MRSWLGRSVVLGVLLLVAYLAFSPVPVRAVAWQAPKSPGYTGPHAPNTRLSGLRHVSLGRDAGPEHVAVGPDGRLYVAVASGAILRAEAGTDVLNPWVHTGGRVLGFDFDAAGRLIAADAVRGLLAIAPDGTEEVLLDAQRDGIGYADGVVVSPATGLVYLTDASQRFRPADWGGTFEASILDTLEHSGSGRLLVFDPKTRRMDVVMKDLQFPNGLALTEDGRSLLMSETSMYRVWRVSVDARGLSAASAPADQARVVVDNLPAFPDNVMRGREGRFWVGLVKPRSPVVDGLSSWPRLRAVTLRLPRALWPVPKPYGHVIAIDAEGRVLVDLQDPSGAYPETTAITETPERLYVQSLHAESLGWLPAVPR